MATIEWTVLWLSDLSGAILPFLLIAALIFLALFWFLREGRNAALENQLTRTDFGSPLDFHGTLAVEEHKPGSYVRFSKSTDEAQNLQFKYRWLVGIGPQAIFDEVTFDRSRHVAELKKKNSQTLGFSDFKAIRMREVAGGRDSGSYWHVELIPHKGKPTPFLTSQRGDRRATFENSAPVAKAVSAIMDLPVQVYVAGNVWTPGWPPKTSN